LAVERLSRPAGPATFIGGSLWLVQQILSLETLLVLFLFGVNIRVLLPSIPVPETLLFGALSMAVGGWIVLRDGVYLRGIPLVVAGLLFSGWMAASYGWTPSRVLAKESLPFVLGVNLWALFASACIVAGSRERTIRFLLLLLLIGTLLSVIGNYIYVTHGDFRFYRSGDEDWSHRTYLDWGRIVALASPIAMGFVLFTRFGSGKQFLAAAMLASCLFFLMISGARGPLLGALFASVLAFATSRPRIGNGRIELPQAQLAALFAGIAVFGYIGYMLATGQTTTTLNRFLQLFAQADDPLLRTGANRFDYFEGAYHAWLAAPVLGHGLKGFAIFFCGYDQQGCSPHNAFLQVLAEFGLVGFALFMVFLWMAVRNTGFSRITGDPLLAIIVMLGGVLLVNMLVATDISTNQSVFFLRRLFALRRPDDETDEDADEAFEDELEDEAADD
jgi:O-antigen ligase